MSRFINTELKSDSESSDSDLDSEKMGARVDAELMTKLEKSGSDSEQDILLIHFCLWLYFCESNFLVKLCFKHTFC